MKAFKIYPELCSSLLLQYALGLVWYPKRSNMLGLSAVVKSSLWVYWWQFLCKFYIFPEIGPYLLFAALTLGFQSPGESGCFTSKQVFARLRKRSVKVKGCHTTKRLGDNPVFVGPSLPTFSLIKRPTNLNFVKGDSRLLLCLGDFSPSISCAPVILFSITKSSSFYLSNKFQLYWLKDCPTT